MTGVKRFTRKCSCPSMEVFVWLVLIGPELKEERVTASIPDERTIRTYLGISDDVEIIIGRP